MNAQYDGLLVLLLSLAAGAQACSPPLQRFTGLPPSPFDPSTKNILIIGDSISMGGDPPSDPKTLAGGPGGYGSYVLRLLTEHSIVTVQHNGGPYNRPRPHGADEQGAGSDHVVDCLDYWIGKNSTHPNGLPWDVIHFNAGLHDLQTEGPGGPYADSPANYTRNLRSIWKTLAGTGARLI